MNLFTGSGVGPTIFYVALSIFVGLLLGKIKVAKISLGITWVLFVGIALSACGITLNAEMLHVITHTTSFKGNKLCMGFSPFDKVPADFFSSPLHMPPSFLTACPTKLRLMCKDFRFTES